MTRASSLWSLCSSSMRCVNCAQHTTWPSDAERMTEEDLHVDAEVDPQRKSRGSELDGVEGWGA